MNLVQLGWTMYKICKIWGFEPRPPSKKHKLIYSSLVFIYYIYTHACAHTDIDCPLFGTCRRENFLADTETVEKVYVEEFYVGVTVVMDFDHLDVQGYLSIAITFMFDFLPIEIQSSCFYYFPNHIISLKQKYSLVV